jgi:hypothetical protein
LLLLIGGRSRFFRDADTFWHTVTGQKIIQTGQFIRADPYSCTFPGKAWVAYEWLGECGMALIHDTAGLDGLLLATVTLLAGLYAWLAGRLIRGGLHWSLAGLVVVLALAASSSHFHIRPHVLTLLFFAWTFAALCTFEDGRIGLPRLFWLVPLCWVWANIHGGVLGGLGTIGLALAGWGAAAVLGWPSPLNTLRRWLGLLALLLLCSLVTLINPYGLALPRVWYELMSSPVLPRLVREHAPLSPLSLDGGVVLLFGGLYLFLLAGVLPGRPRATWLLPLAWLVLAVSRIRHAPLFGIAATLALAEMLPATRWARWLAGRGDLFQYPPPDSRPNFDWRPCLLPGLVVLAAAAWVLVEPDRRLAHLDEENWPVALLPQLRDYERSQPPGTPIFNEYELGGFLIYYTPDLRVFVDGRCEVYGPDWLWDVDQAMRYHPERIEQWADQYGFDRALVESGSGFDLYLKEAPGWTEIGRTPSAALYARK